MLLDVVRYDLRLSWRVVLWQHLFFAVSVSLFMAHGSTIGVQDMVTSFAMIAGMMSGSVGIQERRGRSAPLLASLPVSRARVVIARYALAFGAGAVALALAAAVTLLPTVHVEHEGTSWAAVFSIAGSALTVTVALVLPLTIRFGNRAFLVLLGAIPFLAIGAVVVVEIVTSSFDVETVAELPAAVGPTTFGASIAALLLALLLISMRVSVDLYQQREL